MGKQNPVQTPPTITKGNTSDIGRPCAKKSITFGPEPKSIVSQLLQKMIREKRFSFPIEQNNSPKSSSDPICIDDENTHVFVPIEETDGSEDFTLKPKKSFKHGCKQERKPNMCYCDHSNCTYSTKISSNLQKHKRIHTGEKPYMCECCSFRTNFSNSLKVHKRLHTDERPYQCTYCAYSCNSISNLKKHSQTKHKDRMNTMDRTGREL